jgi:predicted outer membrane repeat protein
LEEGQITMLRTLIGIVVALGATLGVHASAHAATVTVNTTTPNSSTDSRCGLLEAVQAVNQGSTYRSCTYVADGQPGTIVFSVSGTHNLGSSALAIGRGMTITGRGQTGTIIRSSAPCTICFSGDPNGTFSQLMVSSLTVQYAGGTGTAVGVRAIGTFQPWVGVALHGVRVTGFNNSGLNSSAGLSLVGELVYGDIVNTTLDANKTGIDVSDATLELSNSTVSGNSNRGISAFYSPDPEGDTPVGYVHVYKSAVRNNTAASGAGVFVDHPEAHSGLYQPTLFVELSTISANQATSVNGGGIYSNGATMISGSVIDGNRALAGSGAGVFHAGVSGVKFEMYDTTVSNNHAINGGGMFIQGHAYLFRSTIGPTNLASNDGGGIYCSGQFQVVENMTIDGNTARRGGGVFFAGTEMHLDHSTISNNTATQSSEGAGLYVGGGQAMFSYNIIADNTGSNFKFLSTTAAKCRYNVADDNSTFPTDLSGLPNPNNTNNRDPGLDSALRLAGGPTAVRLLSTNPKSFAIDRIPASETTDQTTLDQRGLTRPRNGAKDMGAVEM